MTVNDHATKLALTLLAFAFPDLASAQTPVVPSEGYSVELDELQDSLVRVGQLSNGDRLQAGPRELRRYGSDGSLLDTILVYGDHSDISDLQDVEVLEVSPAETTVALGVFSTSQGDAIVTVSISDGTVGISPAPTSWRPHVAWRDSQRIFMPAWNSAQAIDYWELDTLAGSSRLVGTLSACLSTGGMAFDGQGHLYTALYCLPIPPFNNNFRGFIFRVDAGLLDGPTPFGQNEATDIYFDDDGAHLDLAIDPTGERLFASEFTDARIIQVDIPTGTQAILMENPDPDQGFHNIEFSPGPAGTFAPYQPETAGRIRADVWNMSSAGEFYVERVRLTPRRPNLEVTPNGTPDQYIRAIQDGPPNGYGALFVGPANALVTPEPTYLFGGLPLFFALNPASSHLAGAPFTLDANGAHTLIFHDPGTVPFQRAGQVILFDATLKVAGSSNVEFL